MTRVRQVPCPVCRTLAAFDKNANPWRPFCSERCRGVDLGAWANEGYRVAQQPRDEDRPEDDGLPPLPH